MIASNVREFGEMLYLSGIMPDADFGKEIIELVDSDMSAEYGILCEDIELYAKCKSDPRSQVEWLGDRSNLLEEIEGDIIPEYAERLKMAGIECTDVDDIVRALLDRLPTEWDL